MTRTCLALLLSVTACNAGDKAAPAKPAATDARVLLAADVPAPAGTAFERVERPFGSLELPKGAGWTTDDGDPYTVEHKDGTVVMLQSQDGIAPSQRDEYLASYDEVQHRDAPKYERDQQVVGTVGGLPAARVEAHFSSAQAFVTRDYLVFGKGKVVMVSARTPKKQAASLAPLVDHVASTLRLR